jgi:cell fate (sporulation/competence/biofilm development) regulator YmcA (YheA/YmcA/DUF963 family)
MEILEIAKELGEEIAKDERHLRLQRATDANDADEALQNLIGDLNMIKLQLKAEYDKNSESDATKELEATLDVKYNQILSTPHMIEYQTAKKDFDDLMSHVSKIIQMTIDGVEESNCGGQCSCCDCCH